MGETRLLGMNRRRFIAAAATATPVALAGCLIGGDELSAELADGESESFEASEGDEYEVLIEVQEGDEIGIRISYDVERSSQEFDDEADAMNAVSGMFQGPVLDERVADEGTFDIETGADGYYEIAVTDGTATITLE